MIRRPNHHFTRRAHNPKKDGSQQKKKNMCSHIQGSKSRKQLVNLWNNEGFIHESCLKAALNMSWNHLPEIWWNYILQYSAKEQQLLLSLLHMVPEGLLWVRCKVHRIFIYLTDLWIRPIVPWSLGAASFDADWNHSEPDNTLKIASFPVFTFIFVFEGLPWDSFICYHPAHLLQRLSGTATFLFG